MGLLGLVGVVFFAVAAAGYPDIFFERRVSYIVGLVFIVLFAATIAVVIYYVERQYRIRRELFATGVELGRSEQRFRSILEHTEDVVFALDENGLISFISPNAAEITGFSADELVGTHFTWLLSPDSQTEASYHFGMALAGQTESETFELEVLKKDRQLLPMEARATAMRMDGRFLGVMGLLTDLSAVRQAEADLLRYTKALATLTEIGRGSSPAFSIDETLRDSLVSTLGMMGLESGAIYVVDESSQALKLRVSQGLSDGFIESVKSIGVDEVDMRQASRISDEFIVYGVSHMPIRFREAAGREGLRFVFGVPLMIRNRVTGSMMLSNRQAASLGDDEVKILLNVAQKLAVAIENSLLLEQVIKGRTQIEATLESLDDPVVVLDTDARVSYVNSGVERTLSVNRETAVGMRLQDVLLENMERFPGLPREPSEIDALVKGRLSEAGNTFEMRAELASGSRSFEVAISDINVKGRTEGYVCIMHDVTDYKRLDEMKSDFVAAASHQLRTPLASIVGFGETILHHFDRLDDAEKREYTEIVVRHARKLAGIVNDLLDFSRLEKGEIPLQREKINVPEIAADVLNDFRESYPEHEFGTAFDGDFPMVYADCFKIEHILNNLVGNAVKYSPEGGKVEIGGTCHNGAVEVWVSDEGIGIAPEDVEKLFARFFRSPPSKIIAQDGTGLGLYIVKMLVSAHGGDVRVESSPGDGSKFFFSLPLG
jgi:two-component system phosphate regulon sensor histidine kinase PhoR